MRQYPKRRGPPRRRRCSTAHSYNVRICHWINLVTCAYLLWSGVHIFLDFPELYWGHTGYRGYPAAFRLEDWGLSWDEAGAFGDRRWGRNYHFTFAWVFLINGLAYVVWNLYSTHFRNRMWPARGEWTLANVRTELRDHLRWRSRRHAPNGRYGTLQKTSYLILIFVFVPLMILTGIAQSPGFTAAMPVLLDLSAAVSRRGRFTPSALWRCCCSSSSTSSRSRRRDSSSRSVR